MRAGQTFNARGDGSVSGVRDQTSGMGVGRATSRTGFSLRWMRFVTRSGRFGVHTGEGDPLATTAGKGATFASGNRCQFHATPVAGLRSGSGFIRKVVVTI